MVLDAFKYKVHVPPRAEVLPALFCSLRSVLDLSHRQPISGYLFSRSNSSSRSVKSSDLLHPLESVRVTSHYDGLLGHVYRCSICTWNILVIGDIHAAYSFLPFKIDRLDDEPERRTDTINVLFHDSLHDSRLASVIQTPWLVSICVYASAAQTHNIKIRISLSFRRAFRRTDNMSRAPLHQVYCCFW